MDEKCSAKERMAIGLHMSCCWACRERYTEMRRFRLAMLSEAKAHVPAEFTQAWRAGIRREQFKRAQAGNRRRWFFRFGMLAPAAACVILIATGAVLLNRLPWQKQGAAKGTAVAITQPHAKQPVQNQTTSTPRITSADPAVEANTEPPQLPAQSTPDRQTAAEPIKSADAGSPGVHALAAENVQPEAADFVKAGTSGQSMDASVTPNRAKGSWRVWLASAGDNSRDFQAVLAAAGISPARTAADGSPVVLRDGLDYSSASELSQCLEDAGGHTIIEFVPQ